MNGPIFSSNSGGRGEGDKGSFLSILSYHATLFKLYFHFHLFPYFFTNTRKAGGYGAMNEMSPIYSIKHTDSFKYDFFFFSVGGSSSLNQLYRNKETLYMEGYSHTNACSNIETRS